MYGLHADYLTFRGMALVSCNEPSFSSCHGYFVVSLVCHTEIININVYTIYLTGLTSCGMQVFLKNWYVIFERVFSAMNIHSFRTLKHCITGKQHLIHFILY